MLSFYFDPERIIWISRTRKNYPASFKTKAVISALREDCPVSELASRFGVHSTVIDRWKREALASMEAGFSGKLEALKLAKKWKPRKSKK